MYAFYLSVCVDVTLILGNDMCPDANPYAMWNLGNCTSEPIIPQDCGMPYQCKLIHTKRCCLKPGIHTLVCYSSDEALGLRGARVTIKGHNYCDDFIEYRGLRTVTLRGM